MLWQRRYLQHGEMVSDDTFAALQENYTALQEVYDTVAELYNSDDVEADTDIEDALTEAYSLIEEMGTISQDTITEADAETLNDSFIYMLEALQAIVDAM